MWKCSQCETLNGDDSPICIICGMSRAEVLAEQKRLELERALAASAPARKPEVTLNWPKEDDPAPEEPSVRPLWAAMSESVDARKREQLHLAGRVLAFVALMVQLTLHVTHEDPILTILFYHWSYGDPAFPSILYALAAPATALLIPFLLGRKKRTDALLAALAFTFIYVVAAISLENEFPHSGLLSQFPSLLLAIVLLSCAVQGEIRDWVVPTMWVVTIVSAIAFLFFTFRTTAGSLSLQAWQDDWCNVFLIDDGWRCRNLRRLALFNFYPIHRVFLALAVTLLFRAHREK